MRLGLAVPIALIAAVLLPAPAHAATVDVSANAFLTITGATDAQGVGDVNGDGVADIGVMAPDLSAAYVVFGRLTRGTVDVNALGSRGFKITPAAPDHFRDAGWPPITAAEDVNGDGRGDVLVAAPRADYNGRPESGSAYVVYGRTSTTTVDLAALGTGGFRIDGPASRATDLVGIYQVGMAAAANVGGDARPDVIVSFRFVYPPTGAPSGQYGTSFVVFGGASGTVDTANLGSSGFTIAHSGGAVAGLRDFNGDGRNDLAVARASQGDAHVVFGLGLPVNRDADALGSGGFTITDTFVNNSNGRFTYGVGWTLDNGDVNGDGRPDLVLGEQQVNSCGSCGEFRRRAAVLFGGPSGANVDIASIGSRGFRIDNESTGTLASPRLRGDAAVAGDVNGDVRADVLVGRLGGGPVLLYGKAGTSTVIPNELGDAGVDLTGANPNDEFSYDGVGEEVAILVADVAVADRTSARVYVVSLLPGAAQQLAIIAFRVAGFGLGEPLFGQLIDRLTATRNDVTNNQKRAACLRLAEFTQFVASRNGSGLNGAQTFELVASAGRVSRTLGC